MQWGKCVVQLRSLDRRVGRVGVLVLLVLSISGGAIAYAQSGDGYDLSWWTIDGGGGAVGDSGYTALSTIGQADVGPALTGGTYTLTGGFWPAGATGGGIEVYLPLVLRQ